MDQFADDGFDLLLAGHTHGGQICLPGNRALVTNCGIDRDRASGLHHHPADGAGLAARLRRAWARRRIRRCGSSAAPRPPC